MINLIAAVAYGGVIGNKGRLPWNLKADMARFKKLTMGGVVIFGKNTFEEIGKPLVGRHNVVVSAHMRNFEGVTACSTLDAALEYAKTLNKEIFICGGESIYRQSISIADQLYITHIDKDFDGDRFFPDIPKNFQCVSREFVVDGDTNTWFCKYEKQN